MTARRTDVALTVVPYDSSRREVRMGAGPTHLVALGLSEALHAAGHASRVVMALATATGHCWSSITATVPGSRRMVAAGAITAYDPVYDGDGRIGAAAVSGALALAAAGERGAARR